MLCSLGYTYPGYSSEWDYILASFPGSPHCILGTRLVTVIQLRSNEQELPPSSPYLVAKAIVVSGEGVECSQLLPSRTQLLCCVPKEPTNVCPNLKIEDVVLYATNHILSCTVRGVLIPCTGSPKVFQTVKSPKYLKETVTWKYINTFWPD